MQLMSYMPKLPHELYVIGYIFMISYVPLSLPSLLAYRLPPQGWRMKLMAMAHRKSKIVSNDIELMT
jgi:hypothetical protein